MKSAPEWYRGGGEDQEGEYVINDEALPREDTGSSSQPKEGREKKGRYRNKELQARRKVKKKRTTSKGERKHLKKTVKKMLQVVQYATEPEQGVGEEVRRGNRG